ncbi:MAG: hypothetical protein ABW104_19080 [Candidatus Thiodiazotropha sp. 6PLUC2]
MKGRQQGVVLVLVLWMLVLLLVIVSAVSSTVHTESTLAHNQLDQTRFRAVADAAFYYGAARGYDRDVEMAWNSDGEPYEWQFNGVDMEIRLLKESELIDLNRATAQQLRALLEELEVDPDLHESLIDAILDWRDRDSLHRLNGAEDDDYREAGKAYGAKDAPFTTVDELGLVLGIDADLKTRMLPYLTVGRSGPRQKASPLSGGFGTSLGTAAKNGIWVLVTIATDKQPYYAEALVRQSKDRLRLVTIDYGVSSAAWSLIEE